MVPLYSRVRSLNMFRHSVTGGVGCGALSRQVMRGQSMVEFLIVLPSLLLIVLGILQFSLMYQARNLLNHATFIGARQGALSGGDMTSIKDGVASAMAPLFMRVSLTSRPAMSDVVKARLISTIEIFNLNTALIEILNPTPYMFYKHNRGGAIPNDNLMYRSTASADGGSIQDANLLKIQVTYCFKLVVPFVNQLIYGLNVGLEEVKNLAGISFKPGDTQERNTNLCSDSNKMRDAAKEAAAGFVVDNINAATSGSGIYEGLSTSLTDGAKNAVNAAFGALPPLNWFPLGIRIPITAEATVRMQTPFAMSEE